MKCVSFLLSLIAAVPVDEKSIVLKSCRTTCSGKADNFREFNSYTLELQGKKKVALVVYLCVLMFYNIDVI